MKNDLGIVSQHFKTDKHIRTIEQQWSTKKIQQFLPTSSKFNPFNKDLCKTLLGANIPIKNLIIPILIPFWKNIPT